MASRESERQREERPADGPVGRDEDYAVRLAQNNEGSVGAPDVQLDVPDLRVEEVDLEVEDLQARVSVRAELADLVKIDIGLEVELGEVKLQIKGVEAQAQLKASLDNVRAIFSEVLVSLQHNPQFFRQTLGQTEQTPGVVDDAGDASVPPAGGDSERPGDPNVTSAARKRAEELGLDISDLEGTGSGGRIVVRDVMQAARGYNQAERKE
jgi:pyruvate/2-oxoglutarate dehydrogenase complex dihydrolipoamide acyltransferase (E2) component